MDRRKQTGYQGEKIAVSYLIKSKGYELVRQNWRCPVGELDIIARHNNTLIFVEVRTRRGELFGSAEESITPVKQAKLIELAQTYLQTLINQPHSWRIDVIAVRLGRGLPQINHIENAVGWDC